MARDDVIWEVYGDIISKWPGSTTQDIPEGLRNQNSWIEMFQQRTDPDVIAQTLSNIRQSLATIDLEIVPPDLLSAFARHISVDVEELEYAIAMHHRSQRDKNTIFILPFLPRIEALIELSRLSPDKALLPGQDLDVAIVSIAKAMVHETRHVVGTLVRASLYSLATLLNIVSRSMG